MKRVLLSNMRPVTGKIPKDIVTCDLTAYGSQQTLNAKMIMKRVFVTLKKIMRKWNGWYNLELFQKSSDLVGTGSSLKVILCF